MPSIFEAISKRLLEAWRRPEPSELGRTDSCQCGRPVFFRNSVCLACQTPLGFNPDQLRVRPLELGPVPNTFKMFSQTEDLPLWRRCDNFDSPSGCNWLVPAD